MKMKLLMRCMLAVVLCSSQILAQAEIEPLNNESSADVFLRESLILLRHEAYDSLFQKFDGYRAANPDDPRGYFLTADAYQTLMRDYRIRKYEKEFEHNIDMTIKLLKKQMKGDAPPFSHFLLGAAEGYKGLHMFRLGRWFKALQGLISSINSAQRAVTLDGDFKDPLLNIALYEWAKTKALPFVNRDKSHIIKMLEDVNENARYVNSNALFALQMVYFDAKNYAKARKVNDQLLAAYPHHPVVLYHRAWLFEKEKSFLEANEIWQVLIQQIHDAVQPSHNYLAECHLKRAQNFKEAGEKEKAKTAHAQAKIHAKKFDAKRELEGVFLSYKDIVKGIKSLKIK